MNHLAGQKSPYLLQHADNPVDWYPWSDEAFARARELDRPVFLSIGYSTCHWCHVMERESFSHPEAAALMNAVFVSIKVDREERPDLDERFMEVSQRLTGTGGWPLTILMTPDGKPFYAATYIPREAAYGRMGLMDLVPRVEALWKNERDEVTRSADSVVAALVQTEAREEGGFIPSAATISDAVTSLAGTFDSVHGGFGGAPKFAMPGVFPLLLRAWERGHKASARDMAALSLRAMRNGGVFDQIGGGFHRYATDAEWHVPHFEKMLYDQAQLVLAYVDASSVLHDPFYARVAREVAGYVLRDLTLQTGGFASAEDADSEGEEGRFYVWTEREIEECLGEAASGFAARYDLSAPPGFGAAILRRDPAATAEPGVEENILLRARDRRVRPLRDDKVLTDWNGLMIGALARAGRALNDSRLTSSAAAAATFLLERLRTPAGRLLHRYRDGDAAIPAFADDHAFFAWGLMELYEATFEPRFLEASIALCDALLDHFWDDGEAGFFQTADDAAEKAPRRKSFTDGVLPSANSIGLLVLLRLNRMTGREGFQRQAERLIRIFPADAARHALSYTTFLRAVDFSIGPSREIVIAGDPAAEDTKTMTRALRERAPANSVLLLRPADDGQAVSIIRLAPFLRPLNAREGRATAYVCRDFACSRPVTGVEEALALLEH